MPATPPPLSLEAEVEHFMPVADQVALGDLEIRKRFAFWIVALFIVANLFVMTGLGVVFWYESQQLAAGLIKADDRVIDSKVVMAALGATTVQLGTVIYTIARAIFRDPVR